MGLGKSLRCCLACVLPCGALDVIRIVHLNGHVEEITRPITAGEVLKANPNHVLSKPCSQGVRRILILSPDSDLKRGHIYFLIPACSLPDKKRISSSNHKSSSSSSSSSNKSKNTTTTWAPDLKKSSSSNRKRRCSRVGVWRPHLESISEDS